jgi:hypothetical protein
VVRDRITLHRRREQGESREIDELGEHDRGQQEHETVIRESAQHRSSRKAWPGRSRNYCACGGGGRDHRQREEEPAPVVRVQCREPMREDHDLGKGEYRDREPERDDATHAHERGEARAGNGEKRAG